MRHMNLETLANGAFSVQVNRALKEVAENIQDPNTDASATRKITVAITFKPNKDRDFVATSVQAKTALAPAVGTVTALSMGKDLRTGEVEIAEVMTGQIPGQMTMEESQSIQEAADARTFDPSTVEILEPAGEKPSGERIVDMRRKA